MHMFAVVCIGRPSVCVPHMVYQRESAKHFTLEYVYICVLHLITTELLHSLCFSASTLVTCRRVTQERTLIQR